VTSPLPTTATTSAPPRVWSTVLFDLDGTIVDSASEIMDSLAHMFTEMGVPVPDEDTLRSYVHYDEHLLRSPVFPGVEGVLQRLHTAGVPIALATSKPESMAREVLEHNGLTKYFAEIAGASDDETRSTKADVVAEALRRLQARGVDTTDAVMVGDRGYDILGASAHGVPTVLVEWGYGSPEEAGDALAVVHSADQLRGLLLG
jgi:phosphoglycolate phosphatase